jgi:hypothetical protein
MIASIPYMSLSVKEYKIIEHHYTGRLVELYPNEGETYNQLAKRILKADGYNLTQADFDHPHSWSHNHLEYLVIEHDENPHLYMNDRLLKIEVDQVGKKHGVRYVPTADVYNSEVKDGVIHFHVELFRPDKIRNIIDTIFCETPHLWKLYERQRKVIGLIESE